MEGTCRHAHNPPLLMVGESFLSKTTVPGKIFLRRVEASPSYINTATHRYLASSVCRMQSDIEINLQHVHAIFERCVKENIAIERISKKRTVFSYDWGDLGATYGAAFAGLLEIIAEEKVVIAPIDTACLRQFPDPNDALRVRQNCKTVLLTRSMPHNRAHWIMHQILKHCRWPQPPRTARYNRYCFATQAHINAMIASHRDFLAWAYQCDISKYDQDNDYDTLRNFECVKDQLFPHARGTDEASFRNIDKYFREQHYDFYHFIQDLYLPIPGRVPSQKTHAHVHSLCQRLPELLKKKQNPGACKHEQSYAYSSGMVDRQLDADIQENSQPPAPETH